VDMRHAGRDTQIEVFRLGELASFETLEFV
jgi:hypothetical protein